MLAHALNRETLSHVISGVKGESQRQARDLAAKRVYAAGVG